MSPFDAINGAYELFAGAFLAHNVFRLYKDKQVRGVSFVSMAFFASWGYWNLFFYPHLHQWCSFAGGLGVVLANTAWVILAIRYRK